MAQDANTLLAQVKCFACYGFSQAELLNIALTRRWALSVDPEADVSPEAMIGQTPVPLSYGLNFYEAIGVGINAIATGSTTFDAAACSSDLIVSGTTFECYQVDEVYEGDLPTAGLNISGVFSSNLFMNVGGDDFSGYPDGTFAGGAPASNTTYIAANFVS